MAFFVSRVRLLNELNEKEREYQELLRSSVLKKQEQIDELRKTFIIEGKTYNYRDQCIQIDTCNVTLVSKR